MPRKIDALLDRVRAATPRDPFIAVRKRTDSHRRTHGCGAYTYDKAPLLLALAEALEATQILELGTALGYTSLSLAASSPGAHIQTIEREPQHVVLAREEIARAGHSDRIRVHEGDFMSVLPGLSPGFDLVFFDGFAPDREIFQQLDRLLAPQGVLVSGNLTLGGGDYLANIRDITRWHTRDLDTRGETAVSMRAT